MGVIPPPSPLGLRGSAVLDRPAIYYYALASHTASHTRHDTGVSIIPFSFFLRGYFLDELCTIPTKVILSTWYSMLKEQIDEQADMASRFSNRIAKTNCYIPTNKPICGLGKQ